MKTLLKGVDVERGWAKAKPELPVGGSAILGSGVASNSGVAEETRTRSFATPALAGCAFDGNDG
jgi:hypothetical protein